MNSSPPKCISFTTTTTGVIQRIRKLDKQAQEGTGREAHWYPVLQELLQIKALGSETENAWLCVVPQPEFCRTQVFSNTPGMSNRTSTVVFRSPTGSAPPQDHSYPLRSNMYLQGDSSGLSALSIDFDSDSLHTSTNTAQFSNASSMAPFEQTEEYRRPDFAIIMNTKEEDDLVDFVVSIWEVKAPKNIDDLPKNLATPAEPPKHIGILIKGTKAQASTQAMFVLEEHQNQAAVWSFIVVGNYYRADRYLRSKLPPASRRNGREEEESYDVFEPDFSTVIAPIYTADGTDFHPQFKTVWTRSCKEFTELCGTRVYQH